MTIEATIKRYGKQGDLIAETENSNKYIIIKDKADSLKNRHLFIGEKVLIEITKDSDSYYFGKVTDILNKETPKKRHALLDLATLAELNKDEVIIAKKGVEYEQLTGITKKGAIKLIKTITSLKQENEQLKKAFKQLSKENRKKKRK